MNCRILVALLGLMGIAGLVLLGRGGLSDRRLCAMETAPAGEHRPEGSGGPPPLVIDKDAPLLLDVPTQPTKPPSRPTTGVIADNAACFVCHANYEEEPLAASHARENVGCADCHGKSYAHRNDENNTTPPDVMYPPDKIDVSCKECHATHDVPPGEIIALWLKRCPGKTDPQTIVCTDCHGDHRLKFRTVRWNKKTGKLIVGCEDGEESSPKPGSR